MIKIYIYIYMLIYAEELSNSVTEYFFRQKELNIGFQQNPHLDWKMQSIGTVNEYCKIS